MSEEVGKKILLELKKINEKLDELNEKPKTLSNALKLVAILIGFTVIGPLFAMVLSKLFE